MNLADLQNKLMAAARQQTPDDRVPYAFESRITALLAGRAEANRWVFLTRGLWRAAISCVAVAVICGAVAFFTPSTQDNSNDLSQDFENTLLASVDQSEATP